MKVGKIFKECEKKGAFWVADYEALVCRAKEKGLEEITDELVIEEIKYQFEHAPYGLYFAPVFEFDEEDKINYAEEYQAAKKEYMILKRLYKKYCI